MSEATFTDIQGTLGDAVNAIPLDSLTQNIRLASEIVQSETGIETTNSRFKLLHIYKTAHLLFVGGYLKGPITSEGVADVSVSYGTGALLYPSQYEELYQKLKVNVIGLADRIL